MPRGPSQAALKAKAYALKHPDKLTAEQLAKKFGINPTTVYRSDWWKGRKNPEQPAVQ